MSPIIVNDNNQVVSVRPENDPRKPPVRLGAGRARRVDGAAADLLLALPGVREGSESDLGGPAAVLGSPGADTRLGAALAPARIALRAYALAPLSRVIGDDLAPAGPPSGTITTRQALARDGQSEAFGQHEALTQVEAGREQDESALGSDLVGPGVPTPTAPDVHNAQAAANVAVEAAARDALVEPQQEAVASNGDASEDDKQTADDEAISARRYSDARKASLAAEADRRDVTVTRTDGKDGDLRVADYVAALEAHDKANA